jgi:hypothetical protein
MKRSIIIDELEERQHFLYRGVEYIYLGWEMIVPGRFCPAGRKVYTSDIQFFGCLTVVEKF